MTKLGWILFCVLVMTSAFINDVIFGAYTYQFWISHSLGGIATYYICKFFHSNK